MPEKKTIERARRDRREGKAPTTQAGERQAVAIGLSKARRAGVALPPPKRGRKRSTKKARRATTSRTKTRKRSASKR